MNNAKTTGIGGILDSLLSTAHDDQTQMQTIPSKKSPVTNRVDVDTSVKTQKVAARKGRPPGKGMKRKEPKEKMTVWLDADLIAQYRDWSWDARCQLSTLVEEALLAYRNRRENRKTVPR